jgi:hypothetical protein
MKANELADKYQYSVPYTRKDILEIYAIAYRQAIDDVLKLTNGEVINGTLQGMIEEKKVKELQNEKELQSPC